MLRFLGYKNGHTGRRHKARTFYIITRARCHLLQPSMRSSALRRGAPLSEANTRAPVVADHMDIESAEASDAYDKHNKGAPTPPGSGGLGLSMDIAPLMGRSTTNVGIDRSKIAHAYLTNHSTSSLVKYVVVLLIGVIVLTFVLPLDWKILSLVYGAVCFGAIMSLWLARSVLQCDDGTDEMRQVSDPIREGAEGFLRVQYTVSTTKPGRPTLSRPSTVQLYLHSFATFLTSIYSIRDIMCFPSFWSL